MTTKSKTVMETRGGASKLAEQLQALLDYRNRPEDDPEPVQSNWTVVAANDNADPEEVVDFSFERHLRMSPSVEEIMRQVATGPIVRNDAGQIVKIGKLQFSDGTQTEKSYKVGPDGDVIQFDFTMPLGAMLNTREKGEGPAGGKGYSQVDEINSDKFYASTFGTDMPRFVKRTDRRNGKSLTAAESRKFIDDAIANTPVMPPVTKCPPGLPCGGPRVADSFIGFKKVSSGQSGSVAWQDIAQTIENTVVWRNVRRALRSEDIAVLDAAMQATTLADIDPGGSDRGARKRGKRRLIAANDNLATVLKKFAS